MLNKKFKYVVKPVQIIPLLVKPALAKPVFVKPRSVIVKYSPEETLIYSSYLIGKGIILFTLFYTTMNWWAYKKQYDDLEDKHKNKK